MRAEGLLLPQLVGEYRLTVKRKGYHAGDILHQDCGYLYEYLKKGGGELTVKLHLERATVWACEVRPATT